MEETDLRITIGRRLREERDARHLSQPVVAKELGIDAPSLSRIEQGKRGVSTLVLRRAARFFGLPMDAFFEARTAPLALARAGEAESMSEMLDWGRKLMRSGDLIRSELAARG